MENTFPTAVEELVPQTQMPVAMRILKSLARSSHYQKLENVLFNFDTAALYLSLLISANPHKGHLPEYKDVSVASEWLSML